MSVGGVMNPDSLAETRQAPVEKTDPTGAFYRSNCRPLLNGTKMTPSCDSHEAVKGEAKLAGRHGLLRPLEWLGVRDPLAFPLGICEGVAPCFR